LLGPSRHVVEPGRVSEAFILLSFPAFVVVEVIVSGLGRFGVNEIWSFMISAPLLLSAWYYMIGVLIDRRKAK